MKIGSYVLVRTTSAGVHAGKLVERNGKEVTLADSRRIWEWKTSFTLNGVAVVGVGVGSRLGISVPEILLTEATEVILCSEAAETSIRGMP